MAIEELRTKGDLERFVAERFGLPVNLGGVLRALVAANGGVAFGSSTVTFTAAAISAAVTIPHGLSVVPVFVGCMGKDPENGLFLFMESAAADATNIYIKARQTLNAAVTATQNFYWLAIG